MHDFVELLAAAEAEDGVAPFSEAFVRALEEGAPDYTPLTVDGGLAVLAPDGTAELVVHPAKRRRGRAKELFLLIDASVNHPKLWAHGDLPAAQATARSLGLTAARELLVMAIDATEIAAGPVDVPEGFEALTYTQAVERFGREAVEQAWLEVNNDAFDWHPEQGGWDLDRLHRGMDTDWFDPDGVWLLYNGGGLAGFHWTKRHPDGTGEVYVIGLSSRYRGEGLGVPLLQVGLKHLVEEGSSQVILYVEADNAPAVKRYSETGFTVAEKHVLYEHHSV